MSETRQLPWRWYRCIGCGAGVRLTQHIGDEDFPKEMPCWSCNHQIMTVADGEQVNGEK